MNRSILASAILSSIMLTACGGGGGGGNVKSDPPPPAPTTPTNPNPTTPTDPNPPTTPTEPVTPPRYTGVKDNLLVPANIDVLHERNITGRYSKVAVLDDKLMTYAALDGRIVESVDFTAVPGSEEPEINDKRGHGTLVASIVGGKEVEGFNGGAAPNAQLFYGRVCANNSCNTLDIREAIADFTTDNVKVFNLSLGGYMENEADRIQAAAGWAYAFERLNTVEGLAIVSTGNEGKTNAGIPAATPAYHAELKDNIVAVAALDIGADGKPAGLSSYSNHCGTAANWCLVAPGLISLPALGDTKFQNGAAGTSMSAAVVTGAAALVLQIHPWMSGSNLQTTLLTTATDLGDPGVDSVYGWGLLNAQKAVQGPARFDETFIATTDGFGISTFTNDISGNGKLVKRGTGQLNIAGTTSYTGGTEIQGGTLGLWGTIGGNVTNTGGVLDATRGSGKIGGSYTVAAPATTQLAIGKPLEVGGTANLGGSLHLTPADNSYTVASTETLVKAGSVTGTFSNVSYANNLFYTAALKYDATTVQADLTRTSAAASASAASAPLSVIDGGNQIDALVDELDQRFVAGQTVGLSSILASTGSLMSSDNATAAASLATLTGSIHGVERTLGVQSAINDARVAADRLPHLAGTSDPTAWAEAQHFDGSLSRDGYASADYTQEGLTFGVDAPIGSAGTVIGGALSGGRTRADIGQENAHLDTDRIAVTGYLFQPLGKAYVSAVVSYSDSDVDTRRTVQFGTEFEAITNDRSESAWSARIESGVQFSNGLSPFAAVGAVAHKQDAFGEASASGLGLSAEDDTVNARFADVGVRHRTTQGAWIVDSEIAYRNVFDGRNTDFNAWFTGLKDAMFTVSGQPVARDSLRALFGVGYTFSPTFVLYGNLGAEQVGSNDNNVSANLGLRWKF